MKQLILDGYNVIHDLPVLKKNLILSLEGARTALVNFMQIWSNNHAYKGKINIIFDGTDEFGSAGQSSLSISQATRSINMATRSNGQSSSSNSQSSTTNSNSQSSLSISQATHSNSQPSSSNKQSTHSDIQSSFSINQATRSINCIYSKSGQKADDYIICMVRENKNRSCTTVVSNDNYVRGTCSSLGAATERPSFLKDSPKLKTRKINNQKSANKVSPAHEKEINEFLKEKWGI